MTLSNSGYKLTLMLALSACSVSLIVSIASACNSSFRIRDAACAQWAPITGDISEDACEVAALDVQRAEMALEELRGPREPGAPIWSVTYLHKLRHEALARQMQACSARATALK